MGIEQLNQRIKELAAVLGDLHYKRRGPMSLVARLDADIETMSTRIEALLAVRDAMLAPSLQEGVKDVSTVSKTIDPAADRPSAY